MLDCFEILQTGTGNDTIVAMGWLRCRSSDGRPG